MGSTARSRLVGSGCIDRRTVAACALSLAACQGHLITEIEPDLAPLPPFTKSCQLEGKDVFAPATGPGPNPGTPPPAEWLLRSRFVTIDFDVLTAAATPGDVVRLNLFEDVCFDTVLKRIARSGPSPDLQGWVGSISGDPSSTVSLAFWPRGPLSGTVAAVQAYPRSYLVWNAGGPVHAIYEIDDRRVPPPL